MVDQPKLINIEEVKKFSNGNFSRYSTPTLNFKIYFILKVAGIDPYIEDLTKYLKNVKSSNEALRNIVRYVIQHKKVDYTKSWYKTLKDKVNEFHRRYNRVNLIKENNIQAYRTLFKLYVKLNLDYDFYTPTNTQELDYFIAAQFASKFHSDRGFIGRPTIKIFDYSTCYDNYQKLIHSNYPPTLISEPKEPLYIKEPLDSKMFFQIRDLKDKDCSSFVFIEKPLLNGKVPRVLGLDAKSLRDYIRAIEFLMVRAKLLNRKHNKFLLSIEHMRVCRHVKKVVGV